MSRRMGMRYTSSSRMEAVAEIEALVSIFGDEISVNTNHDRSLTTVRKRVRPNDEEGVSSASIVVEFELGPEYPDVPPQVRLFNPRGISEQSLHQLTEEVQQRVNENVGAPVMFDIFQHCADFILEHQHSSSLACPICLRPLMLASVSSTPCDHYAHSECLEQHTEHTRKQLGEKLAARNFKMCDDIDKSLRCPVCRVVIEEEVEPILQPSSPPGRGRRSSMKEIETLSARRVSQQESYADFEFDWERWRQQQASLMVIYEKQKRKGGIIDLDEERKKNLITEDTVVVLTNELENLVVEPSVSSTMQRSQEIAPVNSALDAPPDFEDLSRYDNPSSSRPPGRGRGDYVHRGRGRDRRFYEDMYRGERRTGRHREYRGRQRPLAPSEHKHEFQVSSKSTEELHDSPDVSTKSAQEHSSGGRFSTGLITKHRPHNRGRFQRARRGSTKDSEGASAFSSKDQVT